jgi:hypothetical protein
MGSHRAKYNYEQKWDTEISWSGEGDWFNVKAHESGFFMDNPQCSVVIRLYRGKTALVTSTGKCGDMRNADGYYFHKKRVNFNQIIEDRQNAAKERSRNVALISQLKARSAASHRLQISLTVVAILCALLTFVL